MARYVKVSSIGIAPCLVHLKDKDVSMVDYVINHLDKNIKQVLCEKPDLIVLPEACDRPKGFEVDECLEYYEQRQDKVLNYLKNVAKDNRCYIAYPSFQKMADGTARNTCQMIDRSGNVIGVYNKNFLVIGETFESNIMCGKEETIFKCDFGTVGAAICFDLNFDDIRQRLKKANPDLIIFVSMYHGGIMQNFFAYDTRSYFVGAIAGLPSEIISPLGEKLAGSTNYFNYVTHKINLDYAVCHLDENRERFDAARAKYGDKIKIHDPGYLGAVLITSESDEFTIKDVIKEFNIEVLDSYFERSIEHRGKYTEK